ncbi:MAG: sugar-binding domain-containing protein [Phycisphaerae bacterium]
MAKQILDLTGRWQFRQYPTAARRMRDLDEGEWLDCTIPNSIFTNLIEANKIDRRDIEAEPENYKWVSDEPWVFRRGFDAPEQLLESDKIELACDGLDTVASVWLNEKLLGRCDNMFIQHRFDITKYIKPADNQILIKFDPAVAHAEKLMERYTPFSAKQFRNPYRAYLRKAQYQFGWDFCPALPGCGIWRPVRIEGTSKGRLSNIHIRTISCDENSADIKAAVTIEGVGKHKFHCRLDIIDDAGKSVGSLEFDPHGQSGSAVVHIDRPQLWFPAGLGKAYLYQARVTLFAGDELIDTAQCDFGIRTVKLNQAADKAGRKFDFEINGQQVYVKGANWIPASIFAGAVTNEDYERLITAAAQANINMLRVWGGGYYENDYFYQLCDRLGIMVWQDFMFACCYYPDRKWFLDKIRDEATLVIQRLYNHPSIVLYCGNNEVDWMHYRLGGGSGKRMHGKTIWHKHLPKIINDLDPDRPYIPTTPFSAAKDPNNPQSGTTHNWLVWSGHQSISSYITEPQQVPRFVTEFGFQSPMCFETLKNFCETKQFRPAVAVLEKHNYQIDGPGRIYRYLGDIFGQAGNIENFIYLSQLTQARAVRTYVEFLRANNNRNSGVMFWQFNDCFAATSWSAIDYCRNNKALYYYARRFYKPVLLTVVPEFEQSQAAAVSLDAVAVNDTYQPLTAKIIAKQTDLYGTCIDKLELPLTVGPFSASQPVHLPRALSRPANPEKSVLHLQLCTHETVLAENLYLYLPDKQIDWPVAQLVTNTTPVADDKLLLTISSDVLAKDLKIDAPHLVWLSDNYIDLLPGSQAVLEMQFDCPLNNYQPEINITCAASALII